MVRQMQQTDIGKTRKPPRQSFTLKIGDLFYVASKDAAGRGVSPSQLWMVTAITRTDVTLSSDSGDTWRLVR